MTVPRETERAEALAAELMSHPGYTTGERRFPRRVSRDEAAESGGGTIYPVRPLTCRYAHAVETPSRCSGANACGQPAASLQYGPLDDYINGARQVLRAAHHALGEPRNRPAALCELVYRQLDAAMAAAKKRERRG